MGIGQFGWEVASGYLFAVRYCIPSELLSHCSAEAPMHPCACMCADFASGTDLRQHGRVDVLLSCLWVDYVALCCLCRVFMSGFRLWFLQTDDASSKACLPDDQVLV
jgi:hypothetical protein